MSRGLGFHSGPDSVVGPDEGGGGIPLSQCFHRILEYIDRYTSALIRFAEDGKLPAWMEGVSPEMLKTIRRRRAFHSGYRMGFDLGQPDRRPRPGAYFGRYPGACTPAFRSSIRRVEEDDGCYADISVVVPLYRRGRVPAGAGRMDQSRVARGEGLSYEVILVDDGSGDGSWRVIESLHERFAAVRGSVRSQLRQIRRSVLRFRRSTRRGGFHDGHRAIRTRRTRFRLCGIWSSTRGTIWCRAGKRSVTTRRGSGGRASFSTGRPASFRESSYMISTAD